MTREIVAARRPSRRPFLATPVLAAAVLAVAVPALAGALEVSLSPGAATWRDRVVVTVSGTVVTSCGPEVVQMRPAGAIPQPGGFIGLEVFLLPCDVLAPRPIPLPGRDDSGLFWFFHPENIELTVKVLEACPLDGHWWVSLAGGSTVEYEVTVTDTAAGRAVSYRNGLGEVPRLVADTAAIATCP